MTGWRERPESHPRWVQRVTGVYHAYSGEVPGWTECNLWIDAAGLAPAEARTPKLCPVCVMAAGRGGSYPPPPEVSP